MTGRLMVTKLKILVTEADHNEAIYIYIHIYVYIFSYLHGV